MAIYREEQQLNDLFKWMISGTVGAIFLYAVYMQLKETRDAEFWVSMLITVLGCAVAIAVLLALRLIVEVRPEGISYRMIPIEWKMRTLPASEIASLEIKKVRHFIGYGGFGRRHRFLKKTVAYLVHRREALHVRMNSGKLYIFSVGNIRSMKQAIEANFPDKLSGSGAFANDDVKY